MKNWITGMLFFLALTIPTPAQQKTKPADVKKLVARIESHSCKNTLSAKTFPKTLGEQVVFSYKHKRYTLYVSGKEAGMPTWLSVWVRPEGTRSQSSLATFSDFGLDGTVDFGLTGPYKGTITQRKRFSSGKFDDDPQTGHEFQQYWQNQYDEAIAVALHLLL